ncbi:hypothetical protein NFI96_028169, partial [Prochilodus magdalenae]
MGKLTEGRCSKQSDISGSYSLLPITEFVYSLEQNAQLNGYSIQGTTFLRPRSWTHPPFCAECAKRLVCDGSDRAWYSNMVLPPFPTADLLMGRTLMESILRQEGERHSEFPSREKRHQDITPVHCLFWVEDAPQVDKNDDDEVVAFVNRFVTCEMPSEDDTEIYEIVSGVQRHSKRHSKSCKKRGTPCRFNFPRPPSSRTFITRRKTETGKDDGNRESPEHSMNVNDIIDRELAEAIVKKVKDILLDPEANFQSADDLFASMGINQELFEAAYIRMTKKTTFVLKRKPRCQ